MNKFGIQNTITIIGAGFSGTLVAIHLLQRATHPLTLQLIERRPEMGQGIAYGTDLDCHLLNVPAGKMSAFVDDPDHFLRWMQSQSSLGMAVTAATFVPRKFYGQYIQAILQEAIAKAPKCIHFERICDEVISVKTEGTEDNKVIIHCQNRTLKADRVVLALGNFPPGNPPVADPSFYHSQRYIQSPWSLDALRSLPRDQPLLLIGSGLTMIDWVIALKEQGHRGTLHVVSRHGLLPKAHRQTQPYPPFLSLDNPPKTVSALVKQVRQAIKQEGENWRSVIDCLRPQTQALWQSLPLKEQQRFLRHVRPYWEVHRHRVAPQIAATIAALLNSGEMLLYAGRIQTYYEESHRVTVLIRRRYSGELLALRVGMIVNCTGPECDYRKFQEPLIVNLIHAGLIQPDSLGLGLKVAANGALIRADDTVSHVLYTLGAPQKGCLWETTAVPEIRVQAMALAQELLQCHQDAAGVLAEAS